MGAACNGVPAWYLRAVACLLSRRNIQYGLADCLFNICHGQQLCAADFRGRHKLMEKAWPAFNGNIIRRRNGEYVVILCFGNVVGVIESIYEKSI